MIKYADRVLETSTTQNTGTINLAGPTAGFQSFVDGVGDGAKVAYFIEDGEDWESGIGTVTAGTPDTLSRTTVLESSNSNALVNWGPGTRNVFLGASSHMMAWRDENKNLIPPMGSGGGTANAQTVTLDPVPLAYSDGMEFSFIATAANTASMTINVNSLGAKTAKLNGENVPNGTIKVGTYVKCRYQTSGDNIHIINFVPVVTRNFMLTGVISPSQITGNTDNYNPTDLDKSTELRLSTDASRNLTGIVAQAPGTILVIKNVGSNNLVLKHDVTSTAANRFYLPSSGDLTVGANGAVILKYDGTSSRWTVIATTGSSSSGASVPSTITGLLPSSITGNATTGALSVSAGTASDSSLAKLMTLSGSASWAVSNGNAALGYQGGTTLPNSANIHFFLCEGSSGVTIFAHNGLTPTPPSGYNTYYRRIFSLRTSAAGALEAGTAIESAGGSMTFFKAALTTDISVTNLSTSRVLYALPVPGDIKVQALIRANGPTNAAFVQICSPDEPDSAYTATTTAPLWDVTGGGTHGYSNFDGYIITDTSRQIAARSNTGSTALYATARGWVDFRR